MFSFFTGLNSKIYLVAGLVFVAVTVGGYIKYLQSNLEDTEVELKTTSLKLDEANKNNELIIQAYEKTLAIEKEIATQKAITQEQKEVVVTKQNKYKEAVTKRGEIKKDEKECSNCTLVHFD
jgi:hypothetical protein